MASTDVASRLGRRSEVAYRASAAAGIAAAVVAVVAIAAALVLAGGRFAFLDHALSDLGRRGWPSATVFNGGMVAAGLLALPFGLALWGDRENAFHVVAIGWFGVAALALVGVGLFPLPTAEHLPVAVTFFVAFTVALLCYGTGDVLAGATRRGLATLWLGVGHVTAWLAWTAFGGLFRGPATPVGFLAGDMAFRTALAPPEAVGVVALVGWLLATAYRLAGTA